MLRRLPAFALAITLALPLSALAQDQKPAEPSDAAEARALKETDSKLSALAHPEAAAKEAKRKHPSKRKKSSYNKKALGKRGAKGKSLKGHKLRKKAQGQGASQSAGGQRMSLGRVREIMGTTRDFSGADLTGLNLVGMDLRQANFSRAKLRQANLERADLSECDLELADLSSANLRGASLAMARLRGTVLDGTKLDGAQWVDHTICRKGSLGRCLE